MNVVLKIISKAAEHAAIIYTFVILPQGQGNQSLLPLFGWLSE